MQFIVYYTKDLYNKYKERKNIHYYIYNFDEEDVKLLSKDTEHLFFSSSFRTLQIIPNSKQHMYIGSNVKWIDTIDNKITLEDFTQNYKYIFINNEDLFCLKSGKALFLKNEVKSIVPYFWKKKIIPTINNDNIVKYFYIFKKDLHLFKPWVDFIWCDEHTYLFDDNEKEEDVFPKEIINFHKNSLVDFTEMKLNCGGQCKYCNKCDLLYENMGLVRKKLGLN